MTAALDAPLDGAAEPAVCGVTGVTGVAGLTGAAGAVVALDVAELGPEVDVVVVGSAVGVGTAVVGAVGVGTVGVGAVEVGELDAGADGEVVGEVDVGAVVVAVGRGDSRARAEWPDTAPLVTATSTATMPRRSERRRFIRTPAVEPGFSVTLVPGRTDRAAAERSECPGQEPLGVWCLSCVAVLGLGRAVRENVVMTQRSCWRGEL
ncbi:MAG: hypothetical protein NVSMB4_08640 [Acidimicrobiales bacterium]